MNLFFPPKYLSLEFGQAKSLSQGWQGLLAGFVSKVCWQGLPVTWTQHFSGLLAVIFPFFSTGHTLANQCSKSSPSAELFCSTSLCFRAWWDASVMFSFYKTTQVEEIGTSINVPQSSTFFLKCCTLLLQAKWGRVAMAERNSPLLHCCVVICKLWVELYCACIDSHLPRIITPWGAWIKDSVSLL